MIFLFPSNMISLSFFVFRNCLNLYFFIRSRILGSMQGSSEIQMAFNPERPKRPAHLPLYSMAFLSDLTDFMTEKMAEALEGLDCEDCNEIRRRLVLFWDHVGVYIHEHGKGKVIADLYLNPPSQYKSNFEAWFSDCWDHSEEGMVELLWRLQATDRVVGAAKWLHSHAKYADTSGFRPRISLK